MSTEISLAIIGGSGLYNLLSLQNVETFDLETPFGNPSSPVRIGTLGERKVAFLARHGIGHIINPTEVNYRANIYALKMLGTTRILAISACGSLRDDFAPGHIVIPDQLFDFTRLRPRSFFGDGLVVHISSADPFCPELSTLASKAAFQAGATVHPNGKLVTIEGPRFSTKLESNLFRGWGLDIIGMTSSPEAFLAREAEICYASMAHVTDYDVWHTSEQPVSVEMVVRTLHQNTALAQQALQIMVDNLPISCNCECNHALESAIITDPAHISPTAQKKYELLIGKYLQK
jgi:5'-methylthioadenosine phosphorylase